MNTGGKNWCLCPESAPEFLSSTPEVMLVFLWVKGLFDGWPEESS